MIKYYMKKEDLRKQKPNLKVIRNISGINDGMAKTFYVDLDTCEVFRVDERYNSVRKNSMGQDYDIVIAKLDATSKTKQNDPCVHINSRLYTVARIMAATGIANPYFYGSIRHKDGNRNNNHLENLEWVSHSQLLKSYYATQKEHKSKKHVFKIEQPKTAAEKMIENFNQTFDIKFDCDDDVIWSEE